MSKLQKPKRRRTNATGRNDGEQYAAFGYPFLQSPAWRSLSGPAVKIFLELRTRFNGSNNGKIALSWDEAAALLGIGKATVGRALEELQTKGIIIETKRGQWYGRRATLWALTVLPVDGIPATHAWKQWTAPQKQSLGSQADHIGWLTGPLQNRSEKIWSATEPVSGIIEGSIGSEMDR